MWRQSSWIRQVLKPTLHLEHQFWELIKPLVNPLEFPTNPWAGLINVVP